MKCHGYEPAGQPLAVTGWAASNRAGERRRLPGSEVEFFAAGGGAGSLPPGDVAFPDCRTSVFGNIVLQASTDRNVVLAQDRAETFGFARPDEPSGSEPPSLRPGHDLRRTRAVPVNCPPSPSSTADSWQVGLGYVGGRLSALPVATRLTCSSEPPTWASRANEARYADHGRQTFRGSRRFHR